MPQGKEALPKWMRVLPSDSTATETAPDWLKVVEEQKVVAPPPPAPPTKYEPPSVGEFFVGRGGREVGTSNEGFLPFAYRKFIQEPASGLEHAIEKIQGLGRTTPQTIGPDLINAALGIIEGAASPIAVVNPIIEAEGAAARKIPLVGGAFDLETHMRNLSEAGGVSAEAIARVVGDTPEQIARAGEIGRTVGGIAPFIAGAGMVKAGMKKPPTLPPETTVRIRDAAELPKLPTGGTGAITSSPEIEKLAAPVRDRLIKSGEDPAKVAAMNVEELQARAVELGVDINAPLSEAPVARGGDMSVRGPANAEAIRRGQFPSGTTVDQAVAPPAAGTPRPAVRLNSGEIIEGPAHDVLKKDPRYNPEAEIGFVVDDTFVNATDLDAAKGDYAKAVEIAKSRPVEFAEEDVPAWLKQDEPKGEAAAPRLTFEEFEQQYRQLWNQGNKYTPKQVGFGQYADEMAKLSDEFPGWADLVEQGLKPGEKPATPAPAESLAPAGTVTPDPKIAEKQLLTLRDKVNKGRYRGRAADITEAEMLAWKNGMDFAIDKGTGKYNVISEAGKKVKKQPEVRMNEQAANPTLLEDIPPETRQRIQDIIGEVGHDIDISTLSREQVKAAIKDLKEDAGKEGTHRAQLLIEELLKAESEGIVGVVVDSAPGIGKDIQGVRVDDLLEQKYEREGMTETRTPGEPITFEKTEAGEQGSFATLDPAKIPDRKPSGISHEQQIEGTMFEKPKTPGAPQSEMFAGGKVEPSPAANDYIQNIKNPEKRAYAEAYHRWILDGRRGEPPSGGKNPRLTSQAVREKLDDVYPPPPPATWGEAVSESLSRLRDRGIITEGLASGLPLDIRKVAYALEPVVKKAIADAKKLVDAGQLKAEEIAGYIRGQIDNLFASDPELSKLTPEQKAAMLQHIKDVSQGVSFNPKTGNIETSRDYAENLRLGRFEERGRGQLEEMVAGESPIDIEVQRRGVRPHEVTETAARREGDVVARARAGTVKPGEAFNAEQLEALDSEVNRVATMTAEEFATQDRNQVANLLRTTHGAHAEAGRALEILGKPIDPTAAANFEKIVEMTNDPELTKAVNETIDLLRKGKKIPPNFWHKVAEWGRNIKLASVSSIVRSTVGNSIMQVFKYPEALFSGQYNRILSALTGKSRDRYSIEAASDFVGTMSGWRDGFPEAWKMLKEEAIPISESAFLQEEVGAMSQGAISGKMGKIIRTPQRIQGAIDVIFRRPSERGFIAKYATRKALQEGKTGRDLLSRIEELRANPPADIIASVATDARYLTYQGKLGGIGTGVNALRLSHPTIQTVVPFYNTWANLFKAAVERTPFGVVTPEFLQASREAFGKKITASDLSLAKVTGKKFEPGIGRMSDKLARITSGSAFMAVSGAIIYRAMDGEITGRGPKTQQERDAKMRMGWQPYSIRLGDKYYSYRGFEPMSTWLGAMADAAQGYEDEGLSSAVSRSTKNIARNFSDNPFMVGIKDAANMISGDENSEANIDRAIAGFAVGMLVPTIAQQTRAIIDPVYRKPSGVAENIKSRVPGMSEGIIPKRTVFGELVETEKPGLRLIAGSVTTRKKDKVEDEIKRLGMILGWPGDTYAGIDLTPQQHDKLVEIAGKEFKKALDMMVGADWYQQLPDGVRISAINNVQNMIREVQRLELFPGVQEEGLLKKAETDLTGGSITPEEKEKLMKALKRAVGQN